MENLKHIFTVQSSVTKALQWIDEDKLLHAHQCLTDLENSRDDILFELHKLPKQYALDKMTLKSNFVKVESVSAQLGQKIRLILDRCLATVRKEPTIIVTAMRIIKREETADTFALQVRFCFFFCVFKTKFDFLIFFFGFLFSKNNKQDSFHQIDQKIGVKWQWTLSTKQLKFALKAPNWKNVMIINCGWFEI